MFERTLLPTIVIGGAENALSIARSLGAAGIRVYAINYPQAAVKYSRFCKWINIPLNGAPTAPEAWVAFLLGRQSDHFRGAVLLAASDEALELIAENRQALAERFTLDISNPAAQLCMLDKLATYQAARSAGVPTPKFWVCDTRDQIEALQDELVFPLILKPLCSHEFTREFGRKLVIVEGFDQLLATFELVSPASIRTFLVEMIPGDDNKLCSYYTYLDGDGTSLFDFTKRVVRRYPVHTGPASYHVTDDVPGVRELALRLVRHVGLRGLANIEFKLDERDGQLKLIECNARFTAADCLLAASGLNLPLFVYNRVTGFPQPVPCNFRRHVRLWAPVADFLAYRQLSRMGRLTFGAWLRSIVRPQVLAWFRWNDPLPALVYAARLTAYPLSRLVRARSSKAASALRVSPVLQTPVVQAPSRTSTSASTKRQSSLRHELAKDAGDRA